MPRKTELDVELKELEVSQSASKSKNSASKFMALIDKYEKFKELTPTRNEFLCR